MKRSASATHFCYWDSLHFLTLKTMSYNWPYIKTFENISQSKSVIFSDQMSCHRWAVKALLSSLPHGSFYKTHLSIWEMTLPGVNKDEERGEGKKTDPQGAIFSHHLHRLFTKRKITRSIPHWRMWMPQGKSQMYYKPAFCHYHLIVLVHFVLLVVFEPNTLSYEFCHYICV